jgi:hypothetical protein
MQKSRSEDPKVFNYDEFYAIARALFDYESPIPLSYEKIPKSSKDRFQRMLPFIDLNGGSQRALWQSFIDKKLIGSDTAVQEQLFGDAHIKIFSDVDSAFLYCFIQHLQPQRIIEIGSGESTKVVRAALKAAGREQTTDHTCIEPYRADKVPQGVKVIQKEMQVVEDAVFETLGDGDILFIDSSHVIMPYGDTLTELLTILPHLKKGVYVHVHDIFLPWDYPPWGYRDAVFTEQYALLLFLYGATDEWEVIWGSNYMARTSKELILSTPNYPKIGPSGGSFWIKKLKDPVWFKDYAA